MRIDHATGALGTAFVVVRSIEPLVLGLITEGCEPPS